MAKKLQVRVWNEFEHEQHNEVVAKIYPDGMHKVIAGFLSEDANLKVSTSTLQEKEHGLSEAALEKTDVLIWWGHMAHQKVEDEIVTRVQQRVLEGMGLIVLHSGHHAKIFKKLMGTTCNLKWREIGERERLSNINPGHPITQGIGEYIDIPNAEMYGERFDIPEPDQLIFISWFEGGEVFRSGCCWERGHGRIFYFRPGHETYPIYYQKDIQKVITNACHWAAPRVRIPANCPNQKPLEKVTKRKVDHSMVPHLH